MFRLSAVRPPLARLLIVLSAIVAALVGVLTACQCPALVPSPVPLRAGCSRVANAGTLQVLAGSELLDLQGGEPDVISDGTVLDLIRDRTGVTVRLIPIGTLAGLDQLVAPSQPGYDAVWFSTNDYLRLHPTGRERIATEVEVMRSPVILGLDESTIQTLRARPGWARNRPTWKEIIDTVGPDAGGTYAFRFGMTEPSHSNSGFSALLAMIAALSGTGSAVTETDVAATRDRLRSFFGAQALFEGSSGWLSNVYRAGAHRHVSGLFNYESELLALQQHAAADKTEADRALPSLTMIYPADGVVMADYPLTLLADADQAARQRYAAVASCLLDVDVQRQIMEQTLRRPVNKQVQLKEVFKVENLFLVSRPGRLADANALMRTFKDEVRQPADVIYLLDTSGSMIERSAPYPGAPDGAIKIDQLRTALAALTGQDPSVSGQLAAVSPRDRVTLVPFNGQVDTPVVFDIAAGATAADIASYVTNKANLSPSGDTALYDALLRGYQIVQDRIQRDTASRMSRFTTIVLLTDGERTTGATACDFRNTHTAIQSNAVRQVRVHVVFLRSMKSQPPTPQPNCDPLDPTFENSPNTVKDLTKTPQPSPSGSADDVYMRAMVALANRTGGRIFDSSTASLAELLKEIRGYQ